MDGPAAGRLPWQQPRAEDREDAVHLVVLTIFPDVAAELILELYRYRWQIELAFKRLKSLLHLGHLKKTDPVGAEARLQGKLSVATLIETLIAVGERFPLGAACCARFEGRRCRWRDAAMMRFLPARAVNPSLSLLEGLRAWNPIALARRGPPRKRRYEHDNLGKF